MARPAAESGAPPTPAQSRNLADILDARVPAHEPLIVELGSDGQERACTATTFRDMLDAAARSLVRQGLRRGDSVAILAENSTNYLAAYMAIMRAGFVAVPISYKLPPAIIAHILKDSGCRFAFVDAARQPHLSGLPAVALDDDGPQPWTAFLDPGPFASFQPGDRDVAMVLYTSGSSGIPKGVPLTHAGQLWATSGFDAYRPAFERQATVVAAPLFHMNGLFSSKVLMRLSSTNVLMRRFSAPAYIQAIARHRCGTVMGIPTMLALVARETEILKGLDLSCVRLVLMGSAPASESLFDEARRIFPNATMISSWGTTESGPTCFGAHPKGLPRPLLSLGYPRPDVAVRLVGDSADEGVLHIRTPALMKGYLNRPEETAKRLKDGWYNTGDVMRRDADGFYYFVGREDDMFICGGENIYPAEVERILEAHAEVAQAAVVPAADAIKGQIPVAFVVPTPGSALDEETLKQFALARGPAYAHPRRIVFRSELPLAGTNKIDRKRLEQEAAALAARSAKT